MRIAVMGAGGIGGCLGGLLARSGNQVTLIARGDHLEAIRSHGLRLNRKAGDFTVDVEATANPEEVGPVDLVLFTVKTYHNKHAIPAMRPMVRDATVILTLQNGVESADELGQEYGAERVLPGAAYISAHIEAPGVITQGSPSARIAFGEADGQESPRARRIAQEFAQAGIQADFVRDVTKVIWSKFLFNAPGNGITSAARTPIRRLMQIPESNDLFLGAMQEAETVARARGADLDSDVVDQAIRFIESVPMDTLGSMQTDLYAGRPLELEALVGAVVRMGEMLAVTTPIHRFMYSVLLNHRYCRKREGS